MYDRSVRIVAAILMCMGLVTAAIADPTVTADEAKRLQTAGYRDATIVYDSAALRVASAKKQGRQRLVVVTPQRLVDAGRVEPGTLAIQSPVLAGGRGVAMPPSVASATSALTMLEVSYRVAGPKDASRSSAKLWFVRADGSIACQVSGGNSNSIGAACGSSGWTNATPKLTPAPDGAMTLDVSYESSGNYSVATSTGDCMPRSPVRSSSRYRWVIPARGTCKEAKVPPGVIVDDQ